MLPNSFCATETVLHLTGPGPVSQWRNDNAFWRRSDTPELTSGQILSVFTYATTWDYQECHPDGAELAIVLDGSIDFLLDGGGGERPVPLEAGTGCVVPAGTWHRLAPRVSSTVLFVTPVPARTHHRDARHLPLSL
jgi:mannose-6-phosphate isomerase-like protein (cupin superfamily)